MFTEEELAESARIEQELAEQDLEVIEAACDLFDKLVAEAPYCTACNGSGEGQYDGSHCSSCKGTGHQYFSIPIEDEIDVDDYWS